MEELSVRISVIGGIAITLALAYLPGLDEKWEDLDGTRKRLVLGLLYLAVSAGLFIPSCFGGPQVVECSVNSIWDVVMAFFLALISSQSMYTVLPTTTKTRMASPQ
jgi:hypothetical protein